VWLSADADCGWVLFGRGQGSALANGWGTAGPAWTWHVEEDSVSDWLLNPKRTIRCPIHSLNHTNTHTTTLVAPGQSFLLHLCLLILPYNSYSSSLPSSIIPSLCGCPLPSAPGSELCWPPGPPSRTLTLEERWGIEYWRHAVRSEHQWLSVEDMELHQPGHP
jgi:hypothetical protein